MSHFVPFRAYRYNPARVGDLSQVVSQPYDKISPEMLEAYLKRHPCNIVRVIKNSNYEEAAAFLNQWIQEGVMIQESSPCFYPYEQVFEFDGQKYSRFGTIGLVSLGDPSLKVKGHERVLNEPLEDRLRLIRLTQANEGLVFMLYADDTMRVENLLRLYGEMVEPTARVVDEYQVIHRLWSLRDERAKEAIIAATKNRPLYIADGHHRFQTAIIYYRECLKQGMVPRAAESFDKRMVAIFNTHDPGLKILPTHRAVRNLEGFSFKKFLEDVSHNFEVRPFGDVAGLVSALEQPGLHLGLLGREPEQVFLLTLKSEVQADESFMPGVQGPSRELLVTILHEGILEPILGIGAAELAEQKYVDYFRKRDELVHRLQLGQFQVAFLLKPTTLEQVRKVSEAGEKMPQKSTDFYPKLLTGLALMKMVMERRRSYNRVRPRDSEFQVS